MARAFVKASAMAVLFLHAFGDSELPVSELPFEDACASDDAECALSLRQLRSQPRSKAVSRQADEAHKLESVLQEKDTVSEKQDVHVASGALPAEAAGAAAAAEEAMLEDMAEGASAVAADVVEGIAAEINEGDAEEAVADSAVTEAPDVAASTASAAESPADTVEEETTDATGVVVATAEGNMAEVVASGATNVTVEAAGGAACKDQTGWDTDFGSRAYRCAFRTMANAYRSGRCMAQRQGVSEACGVCMGYLIHCGMKCMRECCYGKCYQAPKCIECSARNCRQGFMECAGVEPPAVGR